MRAPTNLWTLSEKQGDSMFIFKTSSAIYLLAFWSHWNTETADKFVGSLTELRQIFGSLPSKKDFKTGLMSSWAQTNKNWKESHLFFRLAKLNERTIAWWKRPLEPCQQKWIFDLLNLKNNTAKVTTKSMPPDAYIFGTLVDTSGHCYDHNFLRFSPIFS
jgi:hypothetical protein